MILEESKKRRDLLRKRIFSKIYTITLAERLSASDVLKYIHKIKSSDIPKRSYLNAYTEQELKVINKHLDMIVPKEINKKRNNLKLDK